jgi:outer membrane lipoprotein-sorting protein
MTMKSLLIAAVSVLLSTGLVFGQKLTGDEIIQKVNDNINLKTSYNKSKMTIITSSGSKRTFTMESWSKDRGEKTLVRYQAPIRVKGEAVLMLNNADDIWMFFPRTQRVRKMATHAKKQKMQGSDFSYEDMGSGDAFIEDYDTKRLEDDKKEGYDCYKLELTRKEGSDMSYSRLILWVIKDNFVAVVIDYYDENDPSRLEKQLVQSDIRIIDGIPVAWKAVMLNTNDNKKTEVELLDVKNNIKLTDSLFTERALKK